MPQNFGGELDCSHGMIPSLDEGLLKTADWLALCDNQLPPGPLKWTMGAGGHEVITAVGTTDEKARQLRVGQINLNLERLTTALYRLRTSHSIFLVTAASNPNQESILRAYKAELRAWRHSELCAV
jgi:hypothetical protein